MYAGHLRGMHDRARRRIAHAGDVVAHGARKQLDFLRQIADVAAEIGTVPKGYVGTVQPYCPRGGGHTPTKSRARVDLPAADGPTTASASPGRISKVIPRKAEAPEPGYAKASRSTVMCPCGGGSAIDLTRGGCSGTYAAAVQRCASGDHLFPRPDRVVDRRECPRGQDRAGDHAPSGELLLDRQQGAGAQDRDLHGKPPELGQGDERSRTVARCGLMLQDLPVGREPASDHSRHHAHGVDCLGVTRRHLRTLHRAHCSLIGYAPRCADDQTRYSTANKNNSNAPPPR